jgi:hypothetical protein
MVILRQSPSHNIDVIGKELIPVLVEGTDYIRQHIPLPNLATANVRINIDIPAFTIS